MLIRSMILGVGSVNPEAHRHTYTQETRESTHICSDSSLQRFGNSLLPEMFEVSWALVGLMRSRALGSASWLANLDFVIWNMEPDVRRSSHSDSDTHLRIAPTSRPGFGLLSPVFV